MIKRACITHLDSPNKIVSHSIRFLLKLYVFHALEIDFRNSRCKKKSLVKIYPTNWSMNLSPNTVTSTGASIPWASQPVSARKNATVWYWPKAQIPIIKTRTATPSCTCSSFIKSSWVRISDSCHTRPATKIHYTTVIHSVIINVRTAAQSVQTITHHYSLRDPVSKKLLWSARKNTGENSAKTELAAECIFGGL